MSKSANNMRIMIRNLQINLVSVSQFLNEDKKWRIIFHFLNPALTVKQNEWFKYF